MPPGEREPPEPSGPARASTSPGHGGAAYAGAAKCATGASSSSLGASSDGLQPDLATSSHRLPAAAFREIITRLADEYEQMHADVTSLSCRQEGDALPAMLPKEVVSPPAEKSLREEPGAAIEPEERARRPAEVRRSASLADLLASNSWNLTELRRAKLPRANFSRSDKSFVFDLERTSAASVASSRWCLSKANFERVVIFAIVLNVICLGISADVEMFEVQGSDAGRAIEVLHSLELGFFFVCIIEMAIRLASSGKRFFLDPTERAWNIFDMMLLFQGGFEQVSARLSKGGLNLSFLRGIRLLRITKMLRVIRLMRSMKELRMILFAVVGSMRSMLWSMVLVVVVLYMFALIFVQCVLDYIISNDAIAEGLLDDDVLKYWGSVITAMQTLFKASFGGIDWEIAVEPVSDVGVFGVVFFIYIAFFMFVIANTVTSLFVEATIGNATKDFLNSIHDEMAKKETYVDSLAMIFDAIDENKDGEVTLEEFMHQMENPKLLAFFASLDITIADGTFFFRMLSENGTKPVKLDDFVLTCIRIRGNAQAVDLHHLAVRHNQLLQELRGKDTRLEAAARETQSRLDQANTRLEAAARETKWRLDQANRSLEALRSDSDIRGETSLVGRERVEAEGTRVAPALHGVGGRHAEPLRESTSLAL